MQASRTNASASRTRLGFSPASSLPLNSVWGKSLHPGPQVIRDPARPGQFFSQKLGWASRNGSAPSVGKFRVSAIAHFVKSSRRWLHSRARLRTLTVAEAATSDSDIDEAGGQDPVPHLTNILAGTSTHHAWISSCLAPSYIIPSPDSCALGQRTSEL
jgi:hypothetical protein